MMIIPSYSEKPVGFSNYWDKPPILGLPIQFGWEMWEAIKERVVYTFGSTWHQEGKPVAPDYMQAFYGDFPLLGDCKKTERIMFNAITDLVPYYRYISNGQYVQMTMQHILSSIGDASRIEPSPYYLSADWLWQSYKIVNYLRKHPYIIFLQVTDKFNMDYSGYDGVANSNWYEEKPEFESFVPANTALFVYGDGVSLQYAVPLDDPLPSTINSYACHLDNESSSSILNKLKNAFLLLVNQYNGMNNEDRLIYLGNIYGGSTPTEEAGTNFLSWVRSEYQSIPLSVIGISRYLRGCTNKFRYNEIPFNPPFSFQVGGDPNTQN